MNMGMNMANLDNGSSFSGREQFMSFVFLQNAHVPSLNPYQFGSCTQNMLSSELEEFSKATTVQPQKEIPWMTGMMILELFS
jgi:hypothetical protein